MGLASGYVLVYAARVTVQEFRTPPKHVRRKLRLAPLIEVWPGRTLLVSADFGEYYAALVGRKFRKNAPDRRHEELRLRVQSRQVHWNKREGFAAVLTCTGEIRDDVSGWVKIPGVCLLGGDSQAQLLSVGMQVENVLETVGVPGMANPWIGASVKVLSSEVA